MYVRRSIRSPLAVPASSGAWKTTQFKKYNFEAKGVPPVSGHFHPLLKVREEFRKIFFEMGCAREQGNHAGVLRLRSAC